MFQVTILSVQLIEALRPLVPRIKQRDRSLADQLVRAASSIALNLGEAELSDPGNRRARLFTAAGSAHETLIALRVATAWGYVRAADQTAALALLVRIVAILRRMTPR
jgi:four helix bundle protein